MPRKKIARMTTDMSRITSINWKDRHWRIFRFDDRHWRRTRRPTDTDVIIEIVVDGNKETHLVRDKESVVRVGDRLELYR